MELLKFLKDQIERDDVVGDLARDVARDDGFPEKGSRADYRLWLAKRLASEQAMDALEEAMDEAERVRG